ncbi:gamma-interferon-inducible lysosomal thiol reductase-like [Durio zibethinus]|uniref:Gamma-interferon-inducible lysosomal thiol reductase-like n=1 Tax=Durio zibethinus TaxID=66656 RepID=A0A6P6ALW9_DURZI|nr:gamma-interferon-inducible lysosomal thiol reductase-like [Durio zibethinus]
MGTSVFSVLTDYRVMASSQFLFFLLLSLLVIFIYPSHSSPDNNVTEAQSVKPKKVNLSLYYESLCPYCRNFIVSQLVKVFNTDLLNIINLRLVPWGNAEVVKPNKTIICQVSLPFFYLICIHLSFVTSLQPLHPYFGILHHGEDECYLNTIHACAINIWPDLRMHFNFIYCIENQGLHIKNVQHSDGADTLWKACSARLGMDEKLIKNCYDSGYGRKMQIEMQLLLQYATETNNLHPKHLYVPWVTVNNQPLYDVSHSSLCSSLSTPLFLSLTI